MLDVNAACFDIKNTYLLKLMKWIVRYEIYCSVGGTTACRLLLLKYWELLNSTLLKLHLPKKILSDYFCFSTTKPLKAFKTIEGLKDKKPMQLKCMTWSNQCCYACTCIRGWKMTADLDKLQQLLVLKLSPAEHLTE